MRLYDDPPLHNVLHEPQIPPNAGNIARLCAATRCHLVFLGRLGFELTDTHLKRAGLDYWQWVSWEHLPDAGAFFQSLLTDRFRLLSVHTETPYTQMQVQRGDYLFFGKETSGLPKEWLQAHPDRSFCIPMLESNVRSLNLSSAAAIVTYDALRQLGQF
jgi:tRNA (cytidine/uridine-2'-O-)-methyltransferase